MTRSPRRIYLLWLLLLVPTLAVGAGAILLLRREQARVEAGAEAARAAHLAAIVGRTRLVAENMDLLLGDVRDALVGTLRDLPPEGLPDRLAGWPQENPLVRSGFVLASDGGLRIPAPGSEAGREFQQRSQTQLASLHPWQNGTAAPPAPSGSAPQLAAIQVSQPFLTAGPPALSPPPPAALPQLQLSPTAAGLNGFNANSSNLLAPTTNVPALNGAGQNLLQNGGQSQMANGITLNNTANVYPAGANAGNFQSQRKELQVLSKGGFPPTPAAAVERSGWAPLDGGTGATSALVVWFQRGAGAEVRGAELNVGALAAQLADTLPVEFAVGDGYALLDPAGQVQGAKGDVPAGVAPDAIVPLDAALLPGWSAAGFMPAAGSLGAGRPLFVMGSLLTGILVAAILASGSLLLLHARASAAEARRKTSFVANVSHEFKTPLTTIRLYAELLEQGRVRDETRRAGYLRTIGAETQRLVRLVNNVLDFSRLEQGNRQFMREPLDLRAELAAVLDAHAPRIAGAGLRLDRELPAAPLPVTTDRDAFAQIVLNLLENACKYAAEGGEMTVALAHRAGGGAVLRVLDRGPGVPAAHRGRIFEQFHRVDATLTAEKTGAGLGLSIARQLARGLGGDLRHAARADGGAAFILELP